MKEKTRFKQRALYLYPLSLIRNRHLSSRDVRKIKDNISLNMAIMRLVVASLLMLFTIGMIITMGVATKWKQIEVYGLSSALAQAISIIAYVATVIIEIISFFKKDKASVILNRVAAIILYIGVACQMFFGIYADTEMGFTTEKETLSASIIFFAVLLVFQPAYWTDAIILDFSTMSVCVGLSIFLNIRFGMKALHYYIAIAIALPLFCYFIVTLLFYAECQHYKELIENERLTNKAYYDNLTLCKNRHALNLCIEENKARWEENDTNLLLALFDIDNFKDYNDRFSHQGGDYCLKAIADKIRNIFPSPNLDFFRYGGEEFLLILELEDPSSVFETIQKIKDSIQEMNIEAPEGAPEKVVTISMGATLLRDFNNFSFDKEIEKIDRYLYKAKNNGKNISCLDDKLFK